MAELNRYSEPGRPEFRDHRDSRKEFNHHLNVMARIYNEIHRNDPKWLFPMKEDFDES